MPLSLCDVPAYAVWATFMELMSSVMSKAQNPKVVVKSPLLYGDSTRRISLSDVSSSIPSKLGNMEDWKNGLMSMGYVCSLEKLRNDASMPNSPNSPAVILSGLESASYRLEFFSESLQSTSV